MEKIKKSLEESKSISYLVNYFNDLKAKIENVFNENELEKQQKLINRIRLFEQECLKSIIYENSTNLNEIFTNKTIRLISEYGKDKANFLLIINDEYLASTMIDTNNNTTTTSSNNESTVILTNELLKSIYLKNYLNQMNNLKETSLIEMKLNLNYLNSLDLSYSKLATIEAESFRSLINLKVLDLSENYLTYINEMLFCSLTKLIELNLHGNQIVKIDDHSFDLLLQLEKLWLGRNELKEINGIIFEKLINLKELNIYWNKISKIEDNAFQNLNKLEELSIWNNDLSIVNANTFNGLFNLRELNLYQNKISSIQIGSFNSLINCEYLSLGHNLLQNIDLINTFKDLKNLKELDLYKNNKINREFIITLKNTLANLKEIVLSDDVLI
jgi:Leucine-rich repeat (LRR) protein